MATITTKVQMVIVVHKEVVVLVLELVDLSLTDLNAKCVARLVIWLLVASIGLMSHSNVLLNYKALDLTLNLLALCKAMWFKHRLLLKMFKIKNGIIKTNHGTHRIQTSIRILEQQIM